jgi:hypothetical protein
MNTIDRIERLLSYADLPPLPNIDWSIVEWSARNQRKRPSLHSILNSIDSAIGADTELARGGSCRCSAHINGACGNRRAIGARIRMLEELMI